MREEQMVIEDYSAPCGRDHPWSSVFSIGGDEIARVCPACGLAMHPADCGTCGESTWIDVLAKIPFTDGLRTVFCSLACRFEKMRCNRKRTHLAANDGPLCRQKSTDPQKTTITLGSVTCRKCIRAHAKEQLQ